MGKQKYGYLILVVLLLCVRMVQAQTYNGTDSVKKYRSIYNSNKSDYNLGGLYHFESGYYRGVNADSALYYANLFLDIAKKLKSKVGETLALGDVERALRQSGNLAGALNIELQNLERIKQSGSAFGEGFELNSIGNTYLDMGDPRTALNYYRASHAIFLKRAGTGGYWTLNEFSNIGNAYEKLNMPDSALYYELNMYNNKHFPSDIIPELLGRIGNAYLATGKYQDALNYYRKGLVLAPAGSNSTTDAASIHFHLAKLFNRINNADSSIFYARKAYAITKPTSFRGMVLDASRLLADLYGNRANIDSAYHYQQIAMLYNDSLFGAEKFNHIQKILSGEQQRQQAVLQKQEDLKNRYQLIAGITIIVFVLIVALLIWRNNRKQKHTNLLLGEQKEEIEAQRDDLEQTLTDLKAMQTQLIQSEKMASLGELTAGIAHEIQNPLNFINNFSEVNKEMLVEIKEEISKGNMAEVNEIADSLIANEEKINHHGKRADSIVKGMLEHSRNASGQKEPTDINQLADEYLRLSYHGLRAKDKNFNAELVTDFDPSLPKVNATAQDIGRVMLNLFNNAFYAVNQKQKTLDANYKPEVSVTTSSKNGQVVIKVKDNGTGITDARKEKIMQPFFTTKPTGEGTGLGLSLTYDMVVKGHGGKIDVNTKQGEFTEFTVSLPVT
jgi:two-component system, NtrC family, sensor kinase